MKLLGTWLAGAMVVMGAGSALAAERLSNSGVELDPASFAAGGALEARVDVAGDEVLSVHTILRPASTNIQWMRDRDGFWSDWNGNRDDLAPSAARREGDELVFKIFDAPPAGVSSMIVTIAYKTSDGLKYGWFNAAERAE